MGTAPRRSGGRRRSDRSCARTRAGPLQQGWCTLAWSGRGDRWQDRNVALHSRKSSVQLPPPTTLRSGRFHPGRRYAALRRGERSSSIVATEAGSRLLCSRAPLLRHARRRRAAARPSGEPPAGQPPAGHSPPRPAAAGRHSQRPRVRRPPPETCRCRRRSLTDPQVQRRSSRLHAGPRRALARTCHVGRGRPGPGHVRLHVRREGEQEDRAATC